MQINLPSTRSLGSWMAIWLGLALPALSHAQDPYPTPTPPDPLAGVPVQVLDQQQITYGSHTITLNRIAPPVFPSSTSAATPQARTITDGTTHRPQSRGVARSARADGTDDSSEVKTLKIISLSATVYDHQFTTLRWYKGTSPEFSVYVNLDFNYFAGTSQIETDDTIYVIFFGLGNDTAASLAQASQTPPNLAAFPQGYSAYQIISGDPAIHADDVASLEALCAYYDANKTQMIAGYDQQQAANAAHQQWLQTHPLVQPDTVINFWPVKSSVYAASH